MNRIDLIEMRCPRCGGHPAYDRGRLGPDGPRDGGHAAALAFDESAPARAK